MRSYAFARLAQRNVVHRPVIRRYTQKAAENSSNAKNGSDPGPTLNDLDSLDPRPPWLYSYSTLLRILVVPAGFAYAIFFHDFGDNEHVFMPPRRWAQRQKEAFFTLSSAEKELVDNTRDSGDAAGPEKPEVA